MLKTLETELHVETIKSPLKSLFKMRLNKHLFNRVNDKERKRGQRSVVWLKRGQPCLHHLHVLSTVFSWRPFSSFSLWIILLPPSLPPLILPLLISVTGALVPLAWGLMAGGRGFASMTSFEARKNFMQISWLHIQCAAS